MHMQRHKPHSKKPESTAKTAIWGGWNSDNTTWTSLCVINRLRTYDVFCTQLERLLSQPGTDARARIRAHWAELVHFIHHIGLNDERLRIRDIAKKLDDMVGLNYRWPDGYDIDS